MDTTLDMEELFGDASNIPIQPAGIPKGLLDRIDELCSSGCRQKLAWSKIGIIAYIDRDGHGLIVRHLVCSPGDGSWSLGREFPAEDVRLTHEGQELVHISWNYTGSELVVVDILGRISISTVVLALNRIRVIRPAAMDQADDMKSVVGIFWLHQARHTPYYKPAVKGDGQFVYMPVPIKPTGPFHPNGRLAIVAVTRSGSLRLLYAMIDNRWLEISSDLDAISSTDNLISHATICQDKGGTLLLATFTISQQIRLYNINISWNLSTNNAAGAQPQMVNPPTFQIRHIITDTIFAHPPSLNPNDDVFGNSTLKGRSPATLLFFEILPTAPPKKQREPTVPTIFAVFSHQHDTPEGGQHHPPYSTIARWELHETTQKLQASFDGLAAKRGGVSSVREQRSGLKRLLDVCLEKLIISFQDLHHSLMLSLVFSDGSIEFRDRRTLEMIQVDEDFQEVTSMMQTGFGFSDIEKCLHSALSPNMCVLLTLDGQNEAKLYLMSYQRGSLAESNDPGFESAVASLAQQFALSCGHHNNNDDMLALFKQFAKENLQQRFLSEMYRALSLNIDYIGISDHTKLFQNVTLQRCFSIQASFDYAGEYNHRKLSSKFAWAIMHLRYTSLVYAMTFNSPKGGTDFTRPEVLQSLFGIVTWSIDICNYIVDELYSLAEAVAGHEDDIDLINSQITTLNSPALALVLSSGPRTLLRYHVRALRGLLNTANKYRAEVTSSPAQKVAFKDLLQIMGGTNISYEQVYKLTSDLEVGIKTAYANSSVSEAARSKFEKEILISALVPPVLSGPVKVLLTTSLSTLAEEIDRGELYFRDMSWLGLTDDKRSANYRKTHLLDSLRKVGLKKGTPLRRCTRCSSVVEDFQTGRSSAANTVLSSAQLQRACLCGSLWFVNTEETEKGEKGTKTNGGAGMLMGVAG